MPERAPMNERALLVFAGRRPRQVAAAGILLLQLLIAITGNYTLFNLLSAVFCIPLLDDRMLGGGAVQPASEAGCKKAAANPVAADVVPAAAPGVSPFADSRLGRGWVYRRTFSAANPQRRHAERRTRFGSAQTDRRDAIETGVKRRFVSQLLRVCGLKPAKPRIEPSRGSSWRVRRRGFGVGSMTCEISNIFGQAQESGPAGAAIILEGSAATLATGSQTVKVVPTPTVDFTSILPFMVSTA